MIDPAFTWEDDSPLNIPWNRTIIYECHVKGMTKLHPDVSENLRGTYLGLCSDAMIEYFLALGITAIELLPVHQFVVDRHLAELGLTNYWGYNSIGFFAPDVRYAAKGLGNQVYEFKSMVKTLHSAGIEVILDVVYNHTGEGNHLGPTLSLRGIDNRAYYRLDADQRFYTDFTGTGNSLNMQHPRTIQLIMDSLRYWVTDMHIDGFRFDLAPVLARSSTTSTSCPRSSTSFIRIQRSRTSSSSPSPGTSDPVDIRSATFQFAGPSGTANIATPFGITGAATAVRFPISRRGSPARATSTSRVVAGRMRA